MSVEGEIMRRVMFANTYQNGRDKNQMDGWLQFGAFQKTLEDVSKDVGSDDWRRVWDSQLGLYATVQGYFNTFKQWLDGRVPQAVIGHSMTEMNSMAQAGMDKNVPMSRIVHAREQVLSTPALQPEEASGMYAVTVQPEQMQSLLEQLNALRGRFRVYVANFNTPKQIVLSAVKSHLDPALAELKDIRLAKLELPGIKLGYHSPELAHFERVFREMIKQLFGGVALEDPSIAVYSGMRYSEEPDQQVEQNGRITNGDQGQEVLGSQFTHPVLYQPVFAKAVTEVIPRMIITGDPGGRLTRTIGDILIPMGQQISTSAKEDGDDKIAIVPLTANPNSLAEGLQRVKNIFGLDILIPSLAT